MTCFFDCIRRAAALFYAIVNVNDLLKIDPLSFTAATFHATMFSIRKKQLAGKEGTVKKYVPTYEGTLRKHALTVPHCISKCSGIRVFGRRIKSLVFSTDVAIIKNINADAIIAVYPFTPQAGITQAIIGVSDVPVFVGVGGGLTNGQRSAHVAAFAEHQGAFGVVCNTFIDDDTIRAIKSTVEIPVVYTVVSEKVDLESKLAAGIDFVNVSGADRTPAIVAEIRARYPELPIIATGGPTEETILATIAAGANAITYTPPTNGQLFAKDMHRYREWFAHLDDPEDEEESPSDTAQSDE